jgi:thiol-disulfide isomerase/thioredoxin
MDEWFKNTSVKVLNGSDFDDKKPWNSTDKKCMFVGFFADWCGHCRNLKPEYIKFADMAQFIKVAAIDSDSQKALLTRMQQQSSPLKIRGFPTIWIYAKGKPLEEYKGDRTVKAMLTKALDVCNESCDC